MTMIAFITIDSSLVPLIESLRSRHIAKKMFQCNCWIRFNQAGRRNSKPIWALRSGFVFERCRELHRLQGRSFINLGIDTKNLYAIRSRK